VWGYLIGAIFSTFIILIFYVLVLIYYCFGLFNVFVSFVVCPMQRGEKGDKEGDFGQDGDFPIKIGSLVQ
jgi:hypothetical protein